MSFRTFPDYESIRIVLIVKGVHSFTGDWPALNVAVFPKAKVMCSGVLLIEPFESNEETSGEHPVSDYIDFGPGKVLGGGVCSAQ